MPVDDNTIQYDNNQRYKAAKSEVSNTKKDKWLQKYSRRILRLWLQRQAHFGITCTYTTQIEEDLAGFYEDPLKRKFIETTYY